MLYFNERENQVSCCLRVVDVSHTIFSFKLSRQCISEDNNYQILMGFSVEEDSKLNNFYLPICIISNFHNLKLRFPHIE